MGGMEVRERGEKGTKGSERKGKEGKESRGKEGQEKRGEGGKGEARMVGEMGIRVKGRK